VSALVGVYSGTPGTDMRGNEKVDQLAKEVATQGAEVEVDVPMVLAQRDN